jgi:hypothetical protein
MLPQKDLHENSRMQNKIKDPQKCTEEFYEASTETLSKGDAP